MKKRTLASIGIVVLVLAVGLSGFGVYTARRSWPQESGTLQAAGLQDPVDVYRDEWGVPQIYAANSHDLFFAQGYVHAQDRFWQMDVWRHTGEGRLAEMFGASAVDKDQFLRMLGWARVAEQELATLDADTRASLQAYADGVNAYLATHSGSALSLEYAIVGLLSPDYEVEPWTPINSLTFAKLMAWDLGDNRSDEIRNARIIQLVGEDMWRDYAPTYPVDAPAIVPSPALGAGTLPLAELASEMAGLDSFLGGGMRGLGSNNWVIAGERTTTGMPLLANDPHLSIQMPSIWYEIGLHCTTKSPDCPYEVTGFSFASAPGVVIGHNDRIAWGMTNLGPDVQDLYIEKINPDNPNQYEVDGEWVDMQVRDETIRVAGGEDASVAVRQTRHGPVISDLVEDYRALDETTGLALPASYAIAFRWTALEPGFTLRAVLEIDRAQNFDEFRGALRDFTVPSQNFVYADVDGNIGYQMPGSIPIRAKGDGLLPVPGWTGEYEWTGYIPFDELPYSYNPPQGYIATANNAVVGPDYPHLISLSWDRGYRAQRIVEMIEAQEKISAEYIQQIQGDNQVVVAPKILPYLFEVDFSEDPVATRAVNSLRAWDYQSPMNSQPAAIYNAFWAFLMKDLFNDQLPEDLWPGGSDVQALAVEGLLDRPDNPWWDDAKTADVVETRDDVLRKALTETIIELEDRLGENQADWRWGQLHVARFKNSTLGESGIKPIEALFNRGPFATSGASDTVNATGWNATKGFGLTSVPSMRMIVDLGNLDNSLTMHTTGQSGHAYHPHYDDMIDSWRFIQYHPMLWDRATVEQSAAARLTLTP